MHGKNDCLEKGKCKAEFHDAELTVAELLQMLPALRNRALFRPFFAQDLCRRRWFQQGVVFLEYDFLRVMVVASLIVGGI